MKVLVADKLPQTGLDALAQAGYEVVSDPALKDEALTAQVQESGAEVLIVRSTKVPRATLEAGRLGLVVRAGAGYNNVDVAAAAELGIYVANCPGKNAVAVAELAMGLLLSLDRNIPDCVQSLRDGKWNKKGFAKARGVYGRTLGVIGLGEIGRQMILRAQAFGMPVVAWSRSLTDERAAALGIQRAADPLEVARQSDVVSVHVALNDDTRGMIDAEFFAAMREGAFFLNTSRGAVVDGAALQAAIGDKGVRAGLDVWNPQPSDSVADFADPLGALPQVYGTHHIGASTEQAQEAVAAEAVRVACSYKDRGSVPNCVNLQVSSPAAGALVVRHLDQVGVLAFVLEQLKSGEINVQEMSNIHFAGDEGAACATIHVASLPGDALLDSLRADPRILGIRVTA
jgi:D-3-phosphoglycerate dehydrogenase